ncbi:MAG: DsrE family protein, partial [Gemmatimonadota bacterium]
LAGNESHGDLGRALNALTTVKEAKEAGDEVELVFDGAGTQWIPEFGKDDHKLHGVYRQVKDKVAGACEFCASAFGVKEAAKSQDVALLQEFEGHPSLRRRVADGYEVITF